MNIIQETVIFILIRGIRRCTMFKLEGWACSCSMAFVGGLEMSYVNFSRRQIYSVLRELL